MMASAVVGAHAAGLQGPAEIGEGEENDLDRPR
jgi:hypothetical protein